MMTTNAAETVNTCARCVSLSQLWNKPKYCNEHLLRDQYALSPDLPQIRKRQFAENIAHYLEHAPLSELASLASALAAECSHRGIQVAEPLGLAAARLEYCAEVTR